LDVGHNALAAESIVQNFAGEKVTLIYNTYGDKDYREILSILKPIIQSVEIIDVDEGGLWRDISSNRYWMNWISLIEHLKKLRNKQIFSLSAHSA
jgi:folylpolyglutamate synthase/dihydropteroate synthase